MTPLERDIDIMRDVYMTRSQQEAFDRIKAAAQRKESGNE